MQIYPAIDLKNGRCVRLYQGDFAQQTVVNEDPVAQARAFKQEGATFLHIVDLDGAVSGTPVNLPLIEQMIEATGLPVQVGGGIRSHAQIDAYLSAGTRRVIIGSKAVADPAFVQEAVRRYPQQIAVGIDAKNGRVATHGWLEVSEISYLDFAEQMEQLGTRTIIFTDISRDGTLAGPNLEALAALKKRVQAEIIASGGVSNQDDLVKISRLGIEGTIAGKALYSGNLTMSQALEVQNGPY
ncbi:1-(5-phosphoribosyl)-5-[(5-phosphoribosylamino)methylideneamino]imidazole-4-carboxamide isomerase [Listeria costaricensis]|uniref:1-(5-phosphoribosyl)-5-[(5- phosphoribosylamino)methylideneamino]imidazole-4- carboxamide isomerase n=1 Tax=Listeria costaricensis TaxID=2026604 RepID=UPI000C08C72D|nr:1-(5-phosphoribosyl)-5-[(5-phosphoribosylamino)methylideneamino]imidazole-4-carboxamide isomerase [Listeria costaricensis]